MADGGTLGTSDAEAIVSHATRIGGDIVGTTDFTGDGSPDILMSSLGLQILDTGPDCSGTANLMWGDSDDLTGGVIVSPDDLDTMTGAGCNGVTMGTADDLDGDGYSELLIADPGADGLDTFANGGAVYILNGNDLADGATIESTATWTITAEQGGSWLRVNDRLGDHDGDGTAENAASRQFETATLGAGGEYSTAEASADFFHQTSGAGLGTSWAVGPMDDTDAIDDVIMGAPTQGTGATFVFLSKF